MVSGVYTLPTLTGTTVSADKTTGLSNGDEIKVTYALKAGYAWDDNTDPITLTYTVKDLNIGVPKPTEAGGSVAGLNGSGVYTPPTLNGTDVAFKITKGTKDKLKNGDTIEVTYTLKPGYAWEDKSKTPTTLTYTVKNLNIPVQNPAVAGGSVTGASGSGVYTNTCWN